MEYDNTNRGVMFKNDKGDNDKKPDYKGNINVNGEEFWLSCWIKEAQSGKKFMSLSVQPKEAQQQQPQQTVNVQIKKDNQDEIPF